MAQPVSGATLLGVAAVLVLLGYFIRFQRRLYLVVGYEPEYTDRVTLANLAGSLLLLVGGLTIVLGVVVAIGRATPRVWGLYTLVVFVLTTAVGVVGWGRRTPDPVNRRGE